MSDEMKVRVDRAALADAAAWVAQAISKNPSAPVMAGMRITADDDGLRLAGFNYDASHTTHLAAEVGAAGECLVSGRFLVKIASALKGKDVELVLEGSRLSITSGRSTYRAGVMRVADFPTLPTMPPHVGRIEGCNLVELIGIVEHAVSKNAVLKALTAINVVGAAGSLTVVATDRHRMARACSVWNDASGSEFEACVPAEDLTASVKGLSGPVDVAFGDGMFGLSDRSRSITARVFALDKNEAFPMAGVQQLYSHKPTVEVEVEVQPLIEAIKRALIVTEDHDLITLTFAKDLLTLAAASPEATADGIEEVDCEGAADMALRFNGTYLLHTLAAATTSKVRVGLTGSTRPVLIEPIGDDTVAFIVMPRSKL